MRLILTFPVRGKPPALLPGYEYDPGNPFVQRMKWLPCSARVGHKLCNGCPGSAINQTCSYYAKEVDQNVCNTCGGVEAVTKRESERHELETIGITRLATLRSADTGSHLLADVRTLSASLLENSEGQ